MVISGVAPYPSRSNSFRIEPKQMIILVLMCVMLVPQVIAARCTAGPATHLTLLLFSTSFVTAALSVLATFTLPLPPQKLSRLDLIAHHDPLTFAVVGLSLLTPLYWTVEHLSPKSDLGVDATLAQTLSLTFTAAFLGGKPHLIQVAALTLTLALLARAIKKLVILQAQNE